VTPDHVAAIRSQAKAGYAIGPFHVMSLLDALEAAWEDIEVSGNNWARNHALMRERAERAEAAWHEEGEAHTETLAALSRVTALCDTEWELMPGGTYSELVDDRYVSVREIRAAIAGEQ
jgi:hypothetical protein